MLSDFRQILALDISFKNRIPCLSLISPITNLRRPTCRSVTRWQDYLFNIGHLKILKICPKARIFPKLSLKYCLLLNEPSKCCQRCAKFWPNWRNFAQSGHTVTCVQTLALTSAIASWGNLRHARKIGQTQSPNSFYNCKIILQL